MRYISENHPKLNLLHIGACCLLGVLLTVTACTKEDIFGGWMIVAGEEISFSTGSEKAIAGEQAGGSESSSWSTKTVYYHNSDEGGHEWWNGINWVVNDRISIYCDKALVYTYDRTDPDMPYKEEAPYKVAEYKVDAVSTDGGARIAWDEENATTGALQWGTATDAYNFQAVYPARGTAVNGNTLVTFDGTTFTYTLPKNQSYLSVNDKFTCEPHMEYLPMMATKSVSPSEGGDYSYYKGKVFLTFYPAMTAIEFTIKNDYDDEYLRPEYVGLESASHVLCGSATAIFWTDNWGYKITNTDMGFRITSSFSNDTKRVMLSFPDDIAIAKEKTLTFTLFFLDGADDLTFFFKDKATGSVERRLGLRYADKVTDGSVTTGSYLKFNRFTKSYIKGVLVPDGSIVWDVAYSPEAAYWRNQDVEASLTAE